MAAMRVIDEQIRLAAGNLRRMVFMVEGNNLDLGKIESKNCFDRCD
jgi:hypothetical protein